jgi:hypothetical protein
LSSGSFCAQKTASATQPQLCPIGTYIDELGAAGTQSCKDCPNPQDCTVAGKTAPDCTPSVWRPSTFWCYEIRDQVTIITGALVSAITSIYGGIAFYSRFTLGRQRLRALGVELKHLKKPVEVLATAFLIDKVISLHKLKDEVTVKTLWRALPFDEDMDKDVVKVQNVDHLIDARLHRHFAELQARGEPLNLDNLVCSVRAHLQAGDAADHNGSNAAGIPSHPASSSAVLAPGPSDQPSVCSPLNEVVVHESRHSPSQGPREDHPPNPSPGAHTSKSASSLSCALLKLICSPTIVILYFQQRATATEGLLLLQEPRMSIPRQDTAGSLCPHCRQAALVPSPRS